MATLARTRNQKVNNYAFNLRQQSSSRLQFCNRVDSWLRDTFRYRSENKEIVRTPEFMLTDLETIGYSEGDCDDVATLACALSYAVGIPSRLTAIAVHPTMDLEHVFAECQTENGWCVIDPTVELGTTYHVFSVYHEPI